MNILELCLSPALGGLELYLYKAGTALSVNHKVIAVLDPDGKLHKYISDKTDLPVIPMGYTRAYLPFIRARKLAQIIDTNSIDAVHIHWGYDLALAALAKILSKKKPAIIYTRQMEITRNKTDPYHRLLYSQMDLMLTITKTLEQLAKKYIGGSNNKIKTLYHGIAPPERFISSQEKLDKRHETGLDANDFVVGLFGRLEEAKGQHLLIKAVATARKNGTDIRALIVGHEMTPGYRDTLKSLAEDLNIQENITFVDFVDQPQLLMQICDCVVLATYSETFGLVLPEAMACRIAVIGSDSGGVPEIIDHGKTGLLFRSGDVNSLYQQIQSIYNDPALRNDLALAGEKKVEIIFNNDLHNKQLESHFKQLINS